MIDYRSKAQPSAEKRQLSWIKILIILLSLTTLFFVVFVIRSAYISFAQPRHAPLVENLTLPEKPVLTLKKEGKNLEPLIQASWSTFKVKVGDNLGAVFKNAGLSTQDLQAVLNVGSDADSLHSLHPGQTIQVLKDRQGQLLAISHKIDDLKTLQIERKQDTFISRVKEAVLEDRVAYSRASIHDSLFLTGKRIRLEDKILMELAQVFAYDIDFALDIQPDDSFKVLYEEKFVDGKKVGVGSILAAEFVNQGKTYQAVRYTDSSGHSDYFTPNGKGLKRAFIRTPVNYTRISSHFNLNRKHPVLHTIRAHKGVDYAAPTGTHVKAAGHGTVAFKGTKGGYGNTIILQHGKQYSTLYAHLARFHKNLRVGTKVKQGDIIAYVGSSGLATGPHLHYEFRVNNQHRNPLTVALPQSDGVSDHKKPEFIAFSKELFGLMDHHDRVMLASSEDF